MSLVEKRELEVEEEEEDLEPESETVSAAAAAPLHVDPRDHVPLLLRSLCDRGAQVQPDNLIVTKTAQGYKTITYREHQTRSRLLASALARQGIRIGDRVATMLWNNAVHYQCFHAISCMGAVLHTLNTRLSVKDLGYTISHAGDRLVVVDADVLAHLAQVDRRQRKHVLLFVCCGSDGEEGAWTPPDSIPSKRMCDYEDFLRRGTLRFVWPEILEITPHALCYTSGTTGMPKGVTYSHRSTYLHTMVTMTGADQYAIDASMVVMPFVPFFHTLSWGVPFATMMLGTRTVLTDRFNGSRALLDTLLEWGVELTTGVPTVWQGLKEEAIKRGVGKVRSGISLNTIISGGSPTPFGLQEWFYENLGVDIAQGWGMTETNPSGTFARRVQKHCDLRKSVQEQWKNVCKAGIPAPGVEVRIAKHDDLDVEMPQGEAGHLLVRGPWIITRYFQTDAPDKFHKGWLITGDIARLDEDGAVNLLDRTKDLVKSGGEWISSSDLESNILMLDYISTCAVVGMPHPKWDERPVAVVTLNPDKEVDASQLTQLVRTHCLKHFAKFQIPDDVLVWDEIPLNSTGKMDKKAVRELLAKEKYVVPSAREETAALAAETTVDIAGSRQFASLAPNSTRSRL
mmetsp:Transcript_13475/g.29548  ORF Transcript_13475/g.29548 Transcript_13475/m.29548 type:complete len:627 (-) Transcript_13475:159-2039(-)|eukprot:CAMPEP_0170593570 /NCGR_PEP_ID=MMETSP0224-20130122/13525_1 /TAXON_ID=285029 /ORGANISM="Togula jolla, Strain CCCM 725" /LENGTH=626 /DNA_ID=CAMNT_0010917545 /DNA_START=79 /DNA_END=1959 /DNA_ORIENTATION=+